MSNACIILSCNKRKKHTHMNTKATRRRMISCYAQIINGYVQGYKIFAMERIRIRHRHSTGIRQFSCITGIENRRLSAEDSHCSKQGPHRIQQWCLQFRVFSLYPLLFSTFKNQPETHRNFHSARVLAESTIKTALFHKNPDLQAKLSLF